MSFRVVLTCAFVCIALRSSWARSVAQKEQEYKVQYYVPQQQYVEEEGVPQHQQQAQQPRYITSPQAQSYQVPQQPRPQYEGPTHRVAQLILPSAADRQVAKVAAQSVGPEYAQQVQLVQQQGLAQEAINTAQRRAQAIYQRAQQQQAQQSQHQAAAAQRQQYLAEVPAKTQYVQYVPQQQPQQYQLQYEQPEQYQPVMKSAPRPQYRRPQAQKKEEEQEEHDTDSSYQFGFDVKDDLYTNYQNRKEQREGGKISGSYSVVDSDGFIRTVTYTADPKEGFKAEVVRKPTDIVVKIPKPKESVEAAPQRVQHHHQYAQEEEEQQYEQPQQYQKYRLPSHQAASPGGQKQIVYQYQ